MPRNTRQRTAQVLQVSSNPSASISRDPVARRGAPKPSGVNKAASVASIATVPTRAEGESDDEDSVVEAPIMAQVDQDESALDEEDDDVYDDDGSPDDEQRLQIMMSLRSDLTRATEEFYNRLQNGDYNNPIFQDILDFKRQTFQAVLKKYADPEAEDIFIDFGWVEDLDQRTGFDSAVAKPVALANLVSGLDQIHSIDGGDMSNVVPFLQSLNTSFPQSFLSPHSQDRYPNLALAIKTCFLVESVAFKASKGISVDVNAAIANTFCVKVDDEATDYSHLFADGPFLNLGGYFDENETNLCSSRAKHLSTLYERNPETHGISEMMEMYPLENLVEELKAWLLERYAELRAERKAAERKAAGTSSIKNGSNEVYYDAPDTIPESVPDSNPDSQDIIRQPPPNARYQMGPSMFKDVSSLRELKASDGRFRPPPSNQHEKAPSDAPSDYPEHSTAALLADDLIPASSAKIGHKRRHTTGQDVDEDDEDDDEFQTDARQVDEGRRATIAADQQKKRKKLASQRFSSMAPPPLPASRSSAPVSSRRQDPISSMPPPSSRVPISSADTEAIRHQKATVIASARARSSHGLEMRQKQRTAWSDHDTELLRSLIAPCQAKWADIERLHTEDFEHPRNQQAYRDKARNMKVDYLIADSVLPPGFDLVALGKKEVLRLQQLGKNPDRKEEDYEQEGEYFRAINTEYAG